MEKGNSRWREQAAQRGPRARAAWGLSAHYGWSRGLQGGGAYEERGEGLERSAELGHVGPRGRGSNGERFCLQAGQKSGLYPESSGSSGRFYPRGGPCAPQKA